jgi:serine/threonine-protein kinase
VAVPFDAVIARAMAKSADQRYPSARAFREALDLLAPAGPAPSAGGYAPSGEETIVRPTGWPATGLKPASQASWPAPVAAAPVTAPVTAPITGAGSGTRFPAASEALKAQAIALLTRHLGPVARVVVKRAADSASNREDFIARVIDTVDAAERAALRRALEVIH